MIELEGKVLEKVRRAVEPYGIHTCEALLDHLDNQPNDLQKLIPEVDLRDLGRSLRRLLPSHDSTPVSHKRGVICDGDNE